MKERFVDNEDAALVDRIRNSHMLIVFTMWDIAEQMAVECAERGKVMRTVLDLMLFSME